MGMKKESIGLFVIGGLVLFGIGMFLIGDRHQLFARHAEYSTEFTNLSGLTTGAKVRVSGLDAGEVLSIGVPDSPAARFRLRFRIDARLRALVRSDSVVTIDREGIVGGTYLSVRPGSSEAPQADALATIPSAEATELSALLTSTAGLLDDVKGALKGVTSAVSNVNDVVVGLKEGRGTAGLLLRDDALASDVRRTVTAAGSSVRDIAADLQNGRGTAGMLLRDEAVAGQIREAVASARAATADLGQAARQADALMADLSSRQIPQKAGELVDRLRDSAQHIHQITSDISKPDQAGVTAGANIRSSLINVNAATANLADVTEAAKHNFLLRGFFNKRGYYSLADISPDKYRRDGAFTNRSNRRIWLSGSELFQNGSDGEELSERGKALLHAALTQRGESFAERAIVIEGYANGGVPADELGLSRSRAMAVRQYVQQRFELDPKNLGVVPMKSAPPKELGRATWDGVCLVVLLGS
jgi:phospholipid/cholesterol/gamma-HCH transport system substrate-binding protein